MRVILVMAVVGVVDILGMSESIRVGTGSCPLRCVC